MTRETKIGLLVGLAFIILFGIILSEKGSGRDQLTTTPIAARDPVIELVPSTDPQQFKLLQANRPTQDATPNAAADQPQPANRPDPEKAKPADRPSELAPKMKDLVAPPPTKALAQIPASSPAGTKPTPDNPQMAGKIKLVAAKGPAPVIAVHHVEPGETLAGICQIYYPGRAYNMVKVVMQANGITRPERLRAGQSLKLPADQPAPPTALTAAKSPAAPSRKPILLSLTETGPVAFTPADPARPQVAYKAVMPHPSSQVARRSAQWYTVQTHDTLSKIAKKFYGRESAWTWLYKHNRDVIRNPHMLRDGLRIRVPNPPPDTVLAVGTARRPG